MWNSVANFILRNRILILGVIAVITAFLGYHAATGMGLDSRFGVMLPKSSQSSKDYDKFKELFGEDGGTLVIAIQTDSLYTEEAFIKWKELGDSILKIDGVEAVVSEATLVTISNNKEDRRFEANLVFSDTSYRDKSVDSIKNEIRNNPFYEGLLYNDKSNVSLMMVQIDDRFLSDRDSANFILEIEELASSYDSYFGPPKFTGLPHLRVVIGKQVFKEMYVFIALLIGITSLLLYLFFRSIRAVLICNLVVGIAVLWSMGIIAWFDFKVSLVMALIPPLMIVIGIPNCIFLLTKYHQEYKMHGNQVKALTRVIKKIGMATFLTNFTTSFGFLTFIATNSTKLMEFGVIASINIILVFVLSICILPIIVSFSKNPSKKHLRHLDRRLAVGLLNRLVGITLNYRKWVYITTLLVVGFSILGMVQITTTGNLTGDLPDSHPIKKDLMFVQDHLGGTIPFEIMIGYKEPGRIAKKHTLRSVEQIENIMAEDTVFSTQLTYIDVLKAANMAFYDNDSSRYTLVTKKRQLGKLKRYIDSSLVTNSTGVGSTMNELLDTANRILRIRTQMKDLGSYQVCEIRDSLYVRIDTILNPNRAEIEGWYDEYTISQDPKSVDSILINNVGITNALAESYITDDDTRFEYDSDWEAFINKQKTKADFDDKLREAIDLEYYDVTITGTSILAAEGTRYLVMNLFTSLFFAIVGIAILMSILFRSWRMVMVSLLPNLVPLVFTAGIMGWFGIPLKPSTLLVFSIAFGISIDDTIHFLAKYRIELQKQNWDLKECVTMAIRETGLGMFYTSIVLFSGFSMFLFSQFGGTQALGLLVSLTLLVAMITNLVFLPTLLMSLQTRVTTKSFEEPYFDAYAEGEDIEWENLDLTDKKPGEEKEQIDQEDPSTS